MVLVNQKLSDTPAKTYPFPLDPFQERSVLCLENNQSILVAAHTSAGKTVVAQYAIAKAIKNNQRVIYTSPIKALSNQKYRELEQEFGDVGLMTGDVTLNSNATCIVMTTEILRNMLYKGSEITREMAWVIFDEVHYMRDKDRGVVWEETIILLPNIVKYVFLSATIPNDKQFAQWICKIKNQPCHLVSTQFRPVPLQHYVYASGADGIFLVVNEKGQFKEDNFNKALSYVDQSNNLDDLTQKSKQSKQKNSQANDMKRLITLIKSKNLDPAIVFAFSKKDCENSALALSKEDFTVSEEKELIETIYIKAISTLAKEDQELPQIQMMLPLLKIGVGVHHGGLLPIVKESVELLFQEGLLKVLFSTETFSMGINMPAKTVVFTNIEKWDGETHRWLRGGEYIQMSGRAGRRGLDDKGITIMMLNKKMDLEICKEMLSGKADPLLSSFKLSYNMIVNLMRIEGLSPDYIVKQSFKQYQSEVSVPDLISDIVSLKDKLNSLKLPYEYEQKIVEIEGLKKEIDKNESLIREIVMQPVNILPRLKKGRLVKVKGFNWGIVVDFKKESIEITNTRQLKKMFIDEPKNKAFSEKEIYEYSDKFKTLSDTKTHQDIYVINVLLYIKDKVDSNRVIMPCDSNDNTGKLGIVPVLFESLEDISNIVMKMNDLSLKDDSVIKKIKAMYLSMMKRWKKEFVADPIKDLQIKDSDVTSSIKKIKIYEESISKKSELLEGILSGDKKKKTKESKETKEEDNNNESNSKYLL